MSSQVSQPYRAMKIYKFTGNLTIDEVANDHIRAEVTLQHTYEEINARC